jgi:dienelactone hydrolase
MIHRLFVLGAVVFTLIEAKAVPLTDEKLQKYFEGEVARIEASTFAGIETADDWNKARPKLHGELREMLGLEPMPSKGDLRAVVTGAIEREGIVVEKVHFQSSPGLYVTGNFYRPAKVEKPLPTILYVCGHGQVKTNGVSYGNKVAYQHHGAWFARNGYTCLTIDSVQLGELEGIHHGTNREGMWWWNSRGYSSAGAEAWNCIRALDYLETRPEVDKTRIGVTGRSGGGAYSWWIAALDERIKVAAPVAGITDLRDHVVDGVVEGHCDCMYFVNTHQWDYPMVAALVAPRPLLIANSDKDAIFPLDGVVRTHSAAARIYGLLGAEKNLGLLITEGPHKDTQDLQLPVFRWFNKHLKGEDPVIEMAATKLFTGQELKVFEKLPDDEITTKAHETFVSRWNQMEKRPLDANRVNAVRATLTEKVFRGFPKATTDFRVEKKTGTEGLTEIRFNSQETVRSRLLMQTIGKPKRIALLVVEEGSPESVIDDWFSKRDSEPHVTKALLFVRGPHITSNDKDRSVAHLRRRYMLVGQTLDSMRVWDILSARNLLREGFKDVPVEFSASGRHAANVMLARILDHDVRLGRAELPAQDDLPDHLNLLRFTSWDEIARVATWHEL